ncbi:PulJ/GspJ family protein [Nocardioides pyridinolyticus]
MTASRDTHARDAGMTLVEVVVAIGLFAVMSTAVLSVLGSAIVAARDDKSRIAAINLAVRELEIVRDMFSSITRGPDQITENRVVNPHPLPGGTAGRPLVVDNIPYTVVREAQWQAVGSEADSSACDDGTSTELAYLHVKVMVTWPGLGDRRPVTVDTVMTPRKGTYSSDLSHIGLKVVGADGEGNGGVLVTATSSTGQVKTGTTASGDAPLYAGRGCVLLSHLPAGDWTVTANSPGFVDPAGRATTTVDVHLAPGQLWRGSVEYDAAATIVATIPHPDGYELPPAVADLPLTLASTGLQPIGARTVAGTGSTRTLTTLWPYASGYDVWTGGCEDGSSSSLVTTLPGQTSSTTVPLGKVEVRAAPGTSVTAVHDPDRLCTATTTIPLGTTVTEVVEPTEEPTPLPSESPTESPTESPGATPTETPTETPAETPTEEPAPGGVLRVLLPYGAWTINGQVVLVGSGTTVVQL